MEGKAGEDFTGKRNRIGRGLEEKENTESRGWAVRGHSVQCMVVGNQKGKGTWDLNEKFLGNKSKRLGIGRQRQADL